MATLPSPVEVNLPGRILARSGLDSQIPGAALRLGEIAFTTDSARFWVGDDSQSPPWIITSKFKGSVDWTNLNPTFGNINVSTINGQTIAQVVAANIPSSNSGSSGSTGSTGSTGSGTTTTVTGAFPIGGITPISGAQIPDGYLVANGALISRTTYSSLWSFAQSSGILVSESTWANNSNGYFAQGDGANTFRIPDLRGCFIRAADNGKGIDSGRTIGSFQSDLLRNHYHPTVHGATYFITVYAAAGPAYVAYDYSTGTFGYDNIAANGGGAETRPFNYAYTFLIRAY